MCLEVTNTKTDKKEKYNPFPYYEIVNQTYWYKWLIVFLLIALVAIVTFQFIIGELSRSLIIAIYVFEGFLLVFPFFFGFFLKKTIRTFIIEENNPLIYEGNTSQLIYRIQMRKLKISSKSFHLNEIRRFEVIQRMKRNNLKLYCALVFNSGEYLTITTTLDEPLTFIYAKALNKFLALNTSLDKKFIMQELAPYIPSKEQRKIKLFRSLKILVIIITMIFVGILSIIFWIGNIELLPGFIILCVGLCIN
ncbi:MAG: hypothetical protein ACW98X_23660, partial [Promethearchaeota archaeon]